MNDNKFYHISSHKKLAESCPIIIRHPEKSFIYKSADNIITTLKPVNIKYYNINAEQNSDEYISDEIVKSDDSIIANENYNDISNINKYKILYNDDTETYNLFKFDIICNNIQCIGMNKQVDTSYDLILDGYKGIFIHCDTDINKSYNQKFIFYSKHIKKNKTIHLNNNQPFYINMAVEQLAYYPLYIICCDIRYITKDFIDIYPFLIKNIIKYEL